MADGSDADEVPDMRFTKSNTTLPVRSVMTTLMNDMAVGDSTHVEHVECDSTVRRNIVTGEWTLYKSSKSDKKKPTTYKQTAQEQRTHERLQDDPKDPLGRNGRAMKEEAFLTLYRPSEKTQWQVRVLKNGFPTLVDEGEPCHSGDKDGLCLELAAIGPQEIIVQHCYNNTCLALMTVEECINVWRATRLRYANMSTDARVRYVAAFENHGLSSGGSLTHPHSQLVGLPYIPSLQLQYYDVASRYFDEFGRSVFSRVLEDLSSDGSRIVFENEQFVCYIPFATERTHEVWIMPKVQRCCFIPEDFSNDGESEHESAELHHLAVAVQACLRMLYDLLNDPDYNIVVRSAPCRLADAPGGAEQIKAYYCWHVVILPCTTRGFRVWGTDCQVGKPEWWADDLRGAAILRASIQELDLQSRLTKAGLSEDHAFDMMERLGESLGYLWKGVSPDILCSKLRRAGLSAELAGLLVEGLQKKKSEEKSSKSTFVQQFRARVNRPAAADLLL